MRLLMDQVGEFVWIGMEIVQCEFLVHIGSASPRRDGVRRYHAELPSMGADRPAGLALADLDEDVIRPWRRVPAIYEIQKRAAGQSLRHRQSGGVEQRRRQVDKRHQ